MKTSTRTIRDCNVAVVGGAGFLGSHLVNHLVEDRGCQVLVLDNLCAGRREYVHPRADFHHCDITTSEEHLKDRFACWHGGVRFVLNYAAWPYIPDSFGRPKHVAAVNFMGAVNVINAAQGAGCEGILQVSSAEIYGESGQYLKTVKNVRVSVQDDEGSHVEGVGKIGEGFPVLPHSTYGAAKAAVDWYCQCAWRERQTPVISLRQFNCVGERETHPYVVPEIISQLAAQQGMEAFGETWDGVVKLGNNSFRDFLYAGDAVRIAVELLEHGQWGEVYNLGSETGVRVYDLARLIGKLMGFTDVMIEEDESRKRPWEIWHLQSCNDKLRNVVKLPDEHAADVPLEEALRRTIKWYEEQGRRWPWE